MDSSAYAGRLSDHLAQLFGRDAVFMDVEDIPLGQNFEQVIDRWIGGCSFVLMIVGPRWREILDAHAQSGQPDYVAHEIEAALERKVTVIPVLVGGAATKQLAGLPAGLAELSRHQAFEIRDGAFAEDCSRLAKNLGPGRNRVVLWVAGAVALTLLLIALSLAGVGPWQAYRQRTARVRQLLATAETQIKLAQFEPAFRTYQEVLKLEPVNHDALNRQADDAMLWSENFHALVREDQKAEDVAGPPLAEIMAALEAGLARTGGHDARAADILAHLGWAHWLNQHIAFKEFGDAAPQALRQSLSIDPANVYAHAMLGNWLLQTNGSFEEAMQHFEAAVKTGREKALVRQMQIGGLISSEEAGARAELTKAANQMRTGGEALSDRYRNRLLYYYDPGSGYRNGELEKTLRAVNGADSWATFLWLDNRQVEEGDLQAHEIRREIVQTKLLEIGGKPVEALARFRTLQRNLKKSSFSGSYAYEVDFFINRLSGK